MFILVCSQLTIGSLFLLPFLPVEQVREGFFRLCGFLFLLLMGLTLVVLQQGIGWNNETVLFLGFFLLLLIYNITLWGKFPQGRKLLLPLLSICGGILLLAQAYFFYQPADASLWEAIFIPLSFLFASLSLGAVCIGLLLGHWYLFVPALPISHLQRLTAYLFFSLIGQGILIGCNLLHYLGLERGETLSEIDLLFSVDFFYIFLVRILVGLLSSLILAVLTWQTLKWKATQAATGILFVALLTVLAGELVSRLLFYYTRIPI
jgi:hypothetical protein